ncbi:MAG: hypothetical protein Ct9H90mP30_2300 [Actinomycetota bacterium]|nr:MAG: hypothetical protein Ct9H90mP30_2300 [Actinomycetota bacterium]
MAKTRRSFRRLLREGEALQGMPGCTGSAEGTARVILDSNDPNSLQPGDILVAPLTDPSWTPLFVPAAAVVVDVGAPLSHAIIVSRELGIPCVVSATDATRRIPDGARINVNGDTGVITFPRSVNYLGISLHGTSLSTRTSPGKGPQKTLSPSIFRMISLVPPPKVFARERKN